MDEPLYPSVQGQPVPDLGLAQYSVSTPMTAIYTNSDSTPPVMTDLPPLDDGDPAGAIHNMGIDPDVPYFHLELANDHDIMTPAQLTAPQGIGSVNSPTFYKPDMSVPSLKMGDLQGPEIDKPDEWAPDPHIGDLLEFAQPGGLDITAATRNPLAIDPMVADLFEYNRPAGLGMPGLLTPDPTLPDLQQPQLTQDVHMIGRPGDLAPDALGEMHQETGHEKLPPGDYKEMWMQQKGRATRRTRHMKLLTAGIDDGDHDYR